MSNNTNEPKRILVIGDWVIDENWFVTKEYLSTSAHVGKQMYCSTKTDKESQIVALCAAGGVTRLLHSLIKHEKNKSNLDVEMYGLGFWEPDDTKYIAALFRNDCLIKNQTPHTIQGMHKMLVNNKNLRITPICDKEEPNYRTLQEPETHCFKCNNECERLFSLSKSESGTWRVIRIYSRTGSQPSMLLERIDWEVNDKKKEDCWHDEGLTVRIKEAFRNIRKKIDVVIVVDHCKGSITKNLIQELSEQKDLKDARWYVRTKDYKKAETWINIIKNRLQLLFLGPMNIELEKEPWYFGHHLSMEAIKNLCEEAGKKIKYKRHTDNITFDYNYEKNVDNNFAVIAFHDDNRIAAFIPHTCCNSTEYKKFKNHGKMYDDPILFITKRKPDPFTYKVQRATVVFSSLIASFEGLHKESQGNQHIGQEDLKRALNCSYSWCKKHEDDLNETPFAEKTIINFGEYYSNALLVNNDFGFEIKKYSLVTEVNAWKQALSYFNNNEFELSSEDNETILPKFQIWRGWSLIKGYIAISSENMVNVAKLVKVVQDFRKEPLPRRSLSCMIKGEPGSGKSYLIERLAEQMDMDFCKFNITQLGSIDDLMSCFDTISSIQTQKPNKPLIVFWDEINAKLNAEYVYSYFLGPIWDGTYRRGGQTFQLRPCVWIFAGTNDDIEEQKERNIRRNKESDFASRINGPNITLEEFEYNRISRLEQLYRSVAILKYKHPELLMISDKVLHYFFNLTPKNQIRSIDFLISKIRNVCHGKITYNDLPDDEEIIEWVKEKPKENLDKDYTEDNNETFFRIYEYPPELI